MTVPTIIDALGMWSSWHLDEPPVGQTGIFAVDLRLADAFRHLLFYQDTNSRLRWLERQVFNPTGSYEGDPYRAELCRWWLAIYDVEKAPRICAWITPELEARA